MLTKAFKRNIYLSILPAFLIFSTFLILPIFILLITSFSRWNGGPLTFIGFANYLRLFNDPAFWKAIVNTIIWISAAVFLHLPLAVLVALILSKKIRGWKIFRTLFFLPNIVSYASLAFVFQQIYNPRYGFVNNALDSMGFKRQDFLFQTDTALTALILTWLFMVGLYMIIIMAEIVAIPDSLYEAAAIDGATQTQQDFFITLPLLRNVLGTCTILTVTQSLIYFEGILLTTEGGPRNATLNLPMLAYKHKELVDWGYANTVGVVIFLLGILSIVLIWRLFRVGNKDLA
jgi:raffinose/stachyose/melibiose transport system permease protein